MATPDQIVALAQVEVGYTENPPGSNRTKYGAWYGFDGVPWCAIFTSYIFCAAGLPLPITTAKGFSYCPYGVNWFQKMGLWTKTGTGPFYRGDVVFFDEGALNGHAPTGVAGHVEIITGTKPDSVFTIGGNTSSSDAGVQANGGGVFARERSLNVIMGVGRPQYSQAPVAPPVFPVQPPVWPGRFLTLTSPLMHGDDVSKLQAKMNTWGSKLTVDGYFGKASSDAVRWWQHAFGITADAVVGRQTWVTFFSH